MERKEGFEVVEKRLEAMRIAGIRMKGKYSDSGRLFGRLGRSVGRWIAGKPLNLYYDGEYRESDADFESCFPVAEGVKPPEGIVVRDLPGGRFVCLVHRGPYEELERSYEKLFAGIGKLGLKPLLPSREVFLKGPGMIFRGNPRNYLTEIQVPVETGP
jgi:effector-binding domain-containing protein